MKDAKVPARVNGETRYSDVTIYPLVADGVGGAVIRVDDVTERVRMEEMMIQSEKMLSVGGLAAGMAHEINNPLAAILQNAQVVVLRTSKDLTANQQTASECGTSMETIHMYMEKREILKMLEAIRVSGERAAKIVENMLSFSRKSESAILPHVLSDLLDNTVELASSDYDLKKKYDFRKIEILREYESNLPEVPCEKTEIQQVILNLLKNAAESMAQQNERGDQPRITLRTSKEDDTVRIEVEDNGSGMNEAIRRRIFEPFFTTKDVGAGTGLGLSISYFIITENHGGTMEVKSAPGEGTKFIIHLPLKKSVRV
jgi:signal transduction histidine kinase